MHPEIHEAAEPPSPLHIPEEEQVQMRAALRRARYGYRLALHV
jgi:hypothetical protein